MVGHEILGNVSALGSNVKKFQVWFMGDVEWLCILNYLLLIYGIGLPKMHSKYIIFQIGDVVGVGPQAFSCGQCFECNVNHENYCSGVWTHEPKTHLRT